MTSGSTQRTEGCAGTGRAFLSNQSDIASSDHWTGIAECPAARRTLNPLALSQGNRTLLRTVLCCSSFPPHEGHRMSSLSHASATEFDYCPLQWPQVGHCDTSTTDCLLEMSWRIHWGHCVSIQEGVVTTPLGAVLPRQCLTALLCRQVEGCLHPGTALHRKASLQSLGVLLYNSVTWIFFCGLWNLQHGVAWLKNLVAVGRVVSPNVFECPFQHDNFWTSCRTCKNEYLQPKPWSWPCPPIASLVGPHLVSGWAGSVQ